VGAALALTGSAGIGCRRPPSRREVLAALVREVAVPQAQETLAASTQLEVAAKALSLSPSAGTLHVAREAWRGAVLAWKRAQCFRNGPLVETNALVRATFWPSRPAAIEAALALPNALDDAFVANLGVDARGCYALEYLLFPERQDEQQAAALFAGDAARRRRELTLGLAGSVARYASTVTKSLGTGDAFAARFAEAGQTSLSTLVNQLIGTIENLSAHRLGLVVGLEESRMLRASEVEGWPSGSSHQMALAQLLGTEAIYRGGPSGGLATLASAAAPALEARVRQRFTEAVNAVRALNAPLERLVTSNRAALTAAATTTKALELAIKVDLASALGVTITFQAGDGD
jgi:predicted lipoprotein